jgi:hypothetical protein
MFAERTNFNKYFYRKKDSDQQVNDRKHLMTGILAWKECFARHREARGEY